MTSDLESDFDFDSPEKDLLSPENIEKVKQTYSDAKNKVNVALNNATEKLKTLTSKPNFGFRRINEMVEESEYLEEYYDKLPLDDAITVFLIVNG